MARVPYRSAEDLPESHQNLLVRPINLFRALANSPDAFRLFHQLGEWIRHDCELDPRLRELAILQVGYQAQSAYEFSHHLQISRAFGVTDADVEALVAESAGETSSLPELDRCVLRMAREMAADRFVQDATWDGVAERFSDARMVDLVVVIGFYAMVVRVLGALEVDNEPEFQSLLGGFGFGADARG